jgi:hypothetical protein
VKPVSRGHLWDKDKMALLDRWLLKRAWIHMKFSATGQEKGDLMIKITTRAGFTVLQKKYNSYFNKIPYTYLTDNSLHF